MSTSLIENENVHSRYRSTIHGAYIDECLGNTFSFENANPTISYPNNSIQGHEDALLSNIDDIEQLLQFQTSHLIDFDFILQQDPITGPAENVAGDETETFSSGTNEHSVELEKSHLKRIQDEVMEESSLTDLLLNGAEAVEADYMELASTVVARLHNLLSTSRLMDSPLDRLAPFFTQALHFKICANSPDLSIKEDFKHWKTNSGSCVSTSAFQMLQELSPYVRFGHFTANQAILEATQGSREIHVIDFDILEGIQWPPFMIDLAIRGNVSLKITAIVLQDVGNQQQNSEVSNIQQTARRLQEFSGSINLDFTFDQILIRREGDFSGIQVSHSSTLVANCMVQQLHHQTDCRFSQLVKTFLKGVIKLSPKIIVLVEDELFHFSNKNPSITFVDFFCEAIHHYTALFDSLASGFSCTGGYNLALRVIEKDFLGTRILDSLRQFPCQYKGKNTSREVVEEDGEGYFSILKGFRRMTMSSYNICQANFLVSLFGGGYWVEHEHCKMALCWKSRHLTTASIWVPISSQEEVAVASTCF